MSATRQRCTGVAFDHAPTFFSIAVANELLRCPLCESEVALSGGVSR